MIQTYLKIITYLIEYHFIRAIALVCRWPIDPLPKLKREQKKTLNNAFKNLLKNWKELIKSTPGCNNYSSLGSHLSRYKLVLNDLKPFLLRKSKKDSFDINSQIIGENCPEYFKRNYHYQTDGYFTFESAARYDHQIELLFLGTGHIMRKVAFSSLQPVLKGNEKILEFGAGSGASGFQFKSLFPNTKLDLLEPGKGYLDYANKIYPKSFIKTFPEFMENFKTDIKYDCIFSCFVMHEIPVEFWDKVTDTIKSTLKTGGHLLIVDSQQNSDPKDHHFALDQFQEDFYEPYFDEYRKKTLEDYFQAKGFTLINKNEVLFSKSLLFTLN